jgi:hypothetical protein
MSGLNIKATETINIGPVKITDSQMIITINKNADGTAVLSMAGKMVNAAQVNELINWAKPFLDLSN